MRCFLKLGFNGASIADLEGATGTNRRQIFRDFESKQSLFIECLQTFAAIASERLLQPLQHPEAGLEQIRSTLYSIAAQPDSPEACFGCLVCNTSIDYSAMRDPAIFTIVNEFLFKIEAAYANALLGAIRKGEIPSDALEDSDLGKVMLAAHVGMLVLVKSGKSREAMEQIAAENVCMLLGKIGFRSP